MQGLERKAKWGLGTRSSGLERESIKLSMKKIRTFSTMKKHAETMWFWSYRAGEVLFLLLLAFWLSGGWGWLPASWVATFDANPKIHRKLLAFAAGGAAILGLALFEWGRRNETIASRSFLVKNIDSWKSHSSLWITGFFILFGSWWTASTLLRHFAFKTSFDMAIFTQAIWNSTQGDWFYSSIKGGISLMGDHFAPLLALIAIPYKLWPEPGLLLAIQAFSAVASVFPLARIVQRSGQSPSWAVLYNLLLVLYLPLRNSVRFDFHPEVVAMPFLFWAFAFLDEKRMFLASLFLALALMAKENVATVTFGFGVYAAFFAPQATPGNSPASRPVVKIGGHDIKHWVFRRPVRFWGIGWMVFSVIYFISVTKWLIPKISGAPYFYLDANFDSLLHAGWGPFLKHLFRPDALNYLGAIFGPLAFTSFLAPVQFVLALPTLTQNILARPQIIFQYTATLTPFVFISSVMALAKVRSYRRYWAYVMLLTAVLFSGGSEIYRMRRQWITITPHTVMVKNALAEIPSTASLRTHEFYAPHAANRKELHIYENNHPKEGGSWKARHTDYVAIDRQLFKEGFEEALAAHIGDGYQIQFEEDGFYILKRTTDP